ncbi:hypothetical protein E8E14_013628 [Neopestalotiopsis sp. 37M]|nr:hypothetical protein E8E14_013628 [Neopestalotiopsis sp. 37M]
MATSSQINPIATEDGHFNDCLQALTFAEDWSNISSPGSPFLQMLTGPLDLELVALNSTLSSVHTQGFDNAPSSEGDHDLDKDTDWARREDYSLHNDILRGIAVSLREEVLFLKNQVLKHGTCDFPPIQNYVVAAASNIYGPTPVK